MTGCDIMLSPQAVQQCALVVHELATNSLKYGALSSREGRVEISGQAQLEGGRPVFVFSWKESGGPPVAPPTRRGFGTVILLESMKGIADIVSMDFPASGLVYEAHINWQFIEASSAAARMAAAAG